jgi:hypothetical protein
LSSNLHHVGVIVSIALYILAKLGLYRFKLFSKPGAHRTARSGSGLTEHNQNEVFCFMQLAVASIDIHPR